MNRPLGDAVFHPTSLVNFRQRLLLHEESALGFATILEALIEAGLVSRQSRQRLDPTPLFARVARMNRLDCVRETLRLALQELEGVVVPKGKGQLHSDRVQNPHDAEATYAVKGQGAQKKEHVGFKIQVAETVSEAVRAPGEPTRNVLTGIVTHRAHESDAVGEAKMEAEQAGKGLAKPPVQYVDGAYVSAQKLAQGHGLRRARSRGLAKARLRNYFSGATCNVKRR